MGEWVKGERAKINSANLCEIIWVNLRETFPETTFFWFFD